MQLRLAANFIKFIVLTQMLQKIMIKKLILKKIKFLVQQYHFNFSQTTF